MPPQQLNIYLKKKHFLENSKRCLLPIQSCLLSELLRMEIEEIYSTTGNRHKNTILDIQSSKLTFFLICKTSSAGSCKWESLKKIFHILHRSMKYVKTNHVNICPHSEDCLLPARTVSDILQILEARNYSFC